MSRFLQNCLSRHWLLTLAVVAISSIGLFKHLISGTDWAAIVSALTATFRGGDVLDTWLNPRDNGYDPNLSGQPRPDDPDHPGDTPC